MPPFCADLAGDDTPAHGGQSLVSRVIFTLYDMEVVLEDAVRQWKAQESNDQILKQVAGFIDFLDTAEPE